MRGFNLPLQNLIQLEKRLQHLSSNMGNTTKGQRTNKKKFTHQEKESANDDGRLVHWEEEWLARLPQEILFEILKYAALPPLVIIRLQLLSKYWNGVFKSNDFWRLMCKQYYISSIYFKEDTDYFSLFLSRLTACFIDEKNISRFEKQIKTLSDQSTIQRIQLANIPGSPPVAIGQHLFTFKMDIKPEDIEPLLIDFELQFKDQRHPNLAVQNLFYNGKPHRIILFSEITDGSLFELLLKRPELITEANVQDITRQILVLAEWLCDHQIFSYQFNHGLLAANLLPNDKIEVKLLPALLHFSELNGNFISFLPTLEMFTGDKCTEKTYSFVVGWIAHMLMTGRLPFMNDLINAKYIQYDFALMVHTHRYLKEPFKFSDPADNHVTPLARDFISKLLATQAADRLSLKEALNHEWLQSTNTNHEPMLHIVESLKKVLTNSLFDVSRFSK